MKINKTDLSLILIAIAFIVLYQYKKGFGHIQNQNLVIKEVPEIVKTNDILKLKSIIPKNLINTNITTTSCTIFLTSTTELSLMDFANDFLEHKLDQPIKTCIGTLNDNLRNAILIAQQSCANDKRDKISNECFKTIIDFKSEAVVSIVKEDAHLDELPSSVLVHFLNLNMKNAYYFEHPQKGIEILNIILSQEPNYLAGHKTKLLLLGLLEGDERKKNGKNFNETLDQAKKMNPNDHELIELELAYFSGILKKSITAKDYSHFLSYLKDELKNDNKDWSIEYYRAWATWNHGTGDFNQVLKILEKARLKAPSNKKILSTIDNLKNGDDDKKLNAFIHPFEFKLDDL